MVDRNRDRSPSPGMLLCSVLFVWTVKTTNQFPMLGSVRDCRLFDLFIVRMKMDAIAF